MNIKKVFIILICVFASIGCTIQNISDSDIDKNLDVILNKNIKNSNKEAIGYQYYLPSYISTRNVKDFNQELYSNGGHFATNTYELGNENLDKEKSNNVELGLHYEGDQLSYHVHVYHNWFDHYIYAKTLDQYENFRLIEYRQADAKFYGTEAEVAYQWNDTYNTSLFGDYVRGKIEDENAPRVPAGRLGTRVKADFDDHWSGSAEYYHVFNQDKFAAYEAETKGYNMVNVGVAYKYPLSGKQEASVFFNANNLLDETVYEHTSFLANIPQIGRNFVVGVNYKF